MAEKVIFDQCLIISATNMELNTSRWIVTNLVPGLEKISSKVEIFNCKENYGCRDSDFSSSLDALTPNSLVFILAFDHHFSENMLCRLFDFRGLKLNYICDSDLDFSRQRKLNLIVNYTCLELYHSYLIFKDRYKNVIYFPFAIGYDAIRCSAKNTDILFLGSPTGCRVRYLKFLLTLGFAIDSNITVDSKPNYASPVKPRFVPACLRDIGICRLMVKTSAALNKFNKTEFLYERLDDASYKNRFLQSALSLGISESGNTDLLPRSYCYIRGREFESLAAGKLHLTRESADLDFLTRSGLVTFKYDSTTSLIESLEYLCGLSSKQSSEIVKHNHDLMGREHTWAARFTSLLDGRLLGSSL